MMNLKAIIINSFCLEGKKIMEYNGLKGIFGNILSIMLCGNGESLIVNANSILILPKTRGRFYELVYIRLEGNSFKSV